MPALLEWLEGTGLGTIGRESLYGFQVLVGVHILGLIFSVGMLLWVDLRMLGLGLSGQRLSVVYRAFSRWFIVGFSVMLLSGAMLFAAFATSAYENGYFRLKILAMVVAGINALVFHFMLGRMSPSADLEAPPGSVRCAGLVSLACWAVVILCGRMMSYTLF
jgi:Family of unknown function (DUF6644)